MAAKGLPAAGSGSIEIAAGSELKYQGKVNFVCGGIDGLKNPRVWVDAYTPGTADLIYGEGGGAGDTFTLGGGWSKWVEQGGGPAHCIAHLAWIMDTHGKEWSGHSAQKEFVELDTVEFDATG